MEKVNNRKNYGYYESYIPALLRNVIFPWGTRKEIENAIIYLLKLLKDVPKEERYLYTQERAPYRWKQYRP